MAPASALRPLATILPACEHCSNFYKSLKGERKGSRVGYPRFKKRIGEQTAECTRAARFKVRRVEGSKWGIVRLPSIGDLKFKWSRDLPSDPSSLTVIKRPSGRYEVSFVVDVTPRVAPDPVHAEAGATRSEHTRGDQVQ